MTRTSKRIIAIAAAIALLICSHGAFAYREAGALGMSGPDGDSPGVDDASSSGAEVPPLGESGRDEEPEEPLHEGPPEYIPQPDVPEDDAELAMPEDAAELAAPLGISGIQPFSGASIGVGTEADFRNAILSYSYDVIYLTEDINMNTASLIQITKPITVVIDGQGHTINEMATGRVINVQPGAAGSEITLRNVSVIGYDYYGFVGGRSGAVTNATVIFDNMTYDGPQLTHWWGVGNGKTVIRDCDITIRDRTGSNPAHEVWQGSWLELEGDISISHNSTVQRVFWTYFAGTARPEYAGTNRGIVLRGGATVTGVSTNQIFQTEVNTTNALVLEDGASFSMTSSGFMLAGAIIYYLDIGQNAALQLLQTANASTAAFNVSGSFNMQPGSVFRVEKQTTQGTASYIYGKVTLNQPKLFLVRSGGTGLTTDTARNWTVTGVNAVNYTSTAGKTYYWNRQDDALSPFDLAITGSAATPSQTLQDIYGNALNAANMAMAQSRVLAIGNYSGGLYAQPAMQSAAIDGSTAGNAGLQAAYYPGGLGGEVYSVIGSAQQDGSFSLPLPTGQSLANATESSRVHLRAYGWGGDLIVDRLFEIADLGEATLYITNQLDFGTQAIPASKDALLNRTQTMSITLVDTAMKARDWQLVASEAQPLTGPTTVAGAFVFRKGGQQVRLNTQDQLITGFSNPGGQSGWSQQLDFGQDEGVVIGVTPSDVLVGEYSGVITWTLINA